MPDAPSIPAAPTYRISEDGRSITCLRCHMTSHNINDVTYLHCGHCYRFHVMGQWGREIRET